jgi:hypothetical protein
MSGKIARWLVLAGGLALAEAAPAAAEDAFDPEVRVREPTRLDWLFAAGARAGHLPGSYDSRRVRYQRYVPPTYKATRAWPLLLFLAPGDDPLGWKAWSKPCQDGEVLFCAAYGAGGNRPFAQRVRATLDVLDDMRGSYRIDPERTYLAGAGSGAHLAGQIAFALPEHFGGWVGQGGAAPPPALDHLAQRAADRLSAALVSGLQGSARREIEDYYYPLYRDLGIRTRLWSAPGPSLPPAATLAGVLAWLEEDGKRRRAEAAVLPGLAASPDTITPLRLLGARAVDLARADLRQLDRVHRGAALLEWVQARCPRTESAERAGELLREIRADADQGKRLAEQAAAFRRPRLAAQARALERAGRPDEARRAWQGLLKAFPGSTEARSAAEAIKKLDAARARTPYLGLAVAGDSNTIKEVMPGGPAARAGLRAGDRVLRWGKERIDSLAGLRKFLAGARPGDPVVLAVQRRSTAVSIILVVGTPPAPADGSK